MDDNEGRISPNEQRQRIMAMQQSIKTLRRDLKQSKVADGTVVRMKKLGGYGQELTYAALWIAGPQRWYLTGNGTGVMTHTEFIAWAGSVSPRSDTIEIAVAWETL